LAAPSDVTLRFLADLRNHARLAPGSVRVLSLERQQDLSSQAVVRLRGPLGIHRSAVTELLPPAGSTIAGRAKIGDHTLADVAWTVQAADPGSVVTLCATVEAASTIDSVLLSFGARRWVAKQFAAALDQLSQELGEARADESRARIIGRTADAVADRGALKPATSPPLPPNAGI
jgi:hypothetical protein